MNILTFTSTVKKVKKLTEDLICLSLSIPKNFSFQPGQFITLSIRNGSETKLRSYSIVDLHNQMIDLCIKLVEGGFASEVLSKTKVGGTFEVKGPLGHFLFAQHDKHKEIWFLGGGTGVVPLYSMIKHFVPVFPDKTFILISSAKTKHDLILHKDFQQLEKKYSHFTYFPTLTREQWSGAVGRIPKHLTGDLKNKTFYICGLKELVTDTKNYLLDKKVQEEDIKFERFS